MSFSPFASDYSSDLLNLEPEDFGTFDVLNLVSSSSSSIDSFWVHDNVVCDAGDTNVLGCGMQQLSGERHFASQFATLQNNSINKMRSLIQRRDLGVPEPLVLKTLDMNAAPKPHTPLRATSSMQKPTTAITVPAAQPSSWTREGELSHPEFAAVEIRFRSRRESFRPMENSLYSTIKYELHHVGIPAGIPVRVRLELLKQQNNERVVPPNQGEALVVEEQDSLVQESTITKRNKLQFKTISHHHQQASFYLLVTYEHETSGKVFLQLRSIAFKVYARRPDVKVPPSRRLKKHRGLSTDELMAQKARKVGQKSKRAEEAPEEKSSKYLAAQEPPQKRIRIDSFSSELDNLWCAMERIQDAHQREVACKMLLSMSSRIAA